MYALIGSDAVLAYDDRGTGPAVVLLHGFPLDARVWVEVRADLSDRYRVLTPDLRGFGRSPGTAPFTIESLADDVRALLASAEALPCVLGGLSMGGYVALAFAKKYPGDLRGLALIDTRADADSPQAKEGRQKMIDLVRAAGSAAAAEQMMPKVTAPGFDRRDPVRAARLRTIMNSCPPRTIENALAAMRDRPDRTAELGMIAVPTLIVVGDQDAVTPPDMAEKMRQAIPRATLAVIEGSGHMTPIEQPAEVSLALSRFVDVVTG